MMNINWLILTDLFCLAYRWNRDGYTIGRPARKVRVYGTWDDGAGFLILGPLFIVAGVYG